MLLTSAPLVTPSALQRAILAACICGLAHSAGAQTPDPESSRPVVLDPSLELQRLGYESNVFNETVDPKSDVVATFRPALDYRLRLGRTRLSGRSVVAFRYFRDFSSERSVDTEHEIGFSADLHRITPYVDGTLLSTKERGGLDIDVRARRFRTGLTGGLDVRVSSKATVGAAAYILRTSFDDAAEVDGISLPARLDRRTEGAAAIFRYALTPLTSLVFSAGGEREVFAGANARGSTSMLIVPRVEFKPFALIQGSAGVGYRRLEPADARLPEFSGVVVSTALTYTLRGVTRFALGAQRDVEYSYRPEFPVYVLNGLSLSVRQQITAVWDVHASAARQHLDYRRLVPLAVPAGTAGPLDLRTEGMTYGAGVGYRVGRGTRIAFDVTRNTRHGGDITRDYECWRAGTSVFYGF